MLSMTGFGAGEATAGPVTVTIDLRSVNHRFLDVATKLPSNLAFLEIEIRARLKDALARGRVTCAATSTLAAEADAPRLDPARVDAAIAQLQEVANRLAAVTGKAQTPTLGDLLRVPDLFHSAQEELTIEHLRAATMAALDRAVVALDVMKTREGDQLVAEMLQRVDRLAAGLTAVEALVPRAAEEAQTRLRDRLAALLQDQIEPQRLAQEAAIIADRASINEECERLGIHLHHFREELRGGGQVAKRLNFLLQEMHREVNTMGSKTNLMDITQIVIGMKDEVESLREQVQNLE